MTLLTANNPPVSDTTTSPVDLNDIREAAQRIKPHIHTTPVMTSRFLDKLAGRSLFFKCEIFQRIGAFKFRGACNAVMKLPEDVAARGVVTHSSGNHGQALALAASLRGITAHIIMPNTAPQVKKDAVAGYGGNVHLSEPNLSARLKLVNSIVEETGAELIPPYDHLDIIAGQGTVALELLEQVHDLDAIVVPVGGGGLISGIAIAAKALNPNIRIYGAEPLGADDMARSMAAGQRVDRHDPKTIADGLMTNLCDTTWNIIHGYVDGAITVSEEQIVDAMRYIYGRMKLVVEPSGAVPLAAVLTDEFKNLEDLSRVALILSGGNIDLDRLPWIKQQN